METVNKIPPPLADDEIDLLEVAMRLWKGRKVIGIFTLVFVLLGAIWIGYKKMTVIPEYTSRVLLYIDTPQPDVIPTLVGGSSFAGEMLEVMLTDPVSGQTATVKEALENNHKPPQGNLASLSARINAVAETAGTCEISATMQHPALAQQLADSVASRFSGFLVDFALQRRSQALKSLENRYREADAAYRQSLAALSGFYRINQRSAAKRDTIAEKQMRAESDIRYDVLSELAIQLEKQRIREQDDIPVVRIIDPASAAGRSNQTDVAKPLTILFFLGAIIGSVWVLVAGYFSRRSSGSHERV